MKIRNKLTYQFFAIGALLLFSASLAIYFFSADYRKEDFYNRLLNKASNTAKLLIEVEGVDAELLKLIEKDNPVSLPMEMISIYNYKDELLYSTTDDTLLNVDLLNDIRLNQEVRFRDGEFEALGFLFTDKYDRFVVIISAVDIYGLKKLKNLRTVLLLVFGISIILVVISGWIYSGRALKPISNVVGQVENITITSLNLRVDEGNGKDEIATLAATFNRMLERLESAFKMQKNFIANASHELRTPLTAITGQLEVVLMNERTAEEYKHAIVSVLDDMKNLNTTSNRLLLLAQTSSESAVAGFKFIRVDELLWQAASELMKRDSNYAVQVALAENLEDQHMTVACNDQLIKTAFSNLMDNACKYSEDHRVHVSLTNSNKNIILEFTDNGIGIDTSELKHIFEPFHRASNAIAYKGHGIGLSLVQRIILLHKGQVSVQSELGKGTKFKVSLPIA